jgi:hypothetical protein
MDIDAGDLATLFTREKLDELLPLELSDRFFDALFGDAAEGAYDIRLAYNGYRDKLLMFELELHQRPGKCLACSVTYGLPSVFSRHPIIDLPGLVARIGALLDGHGRCGEWKLGPTKEISRKLHTVPLTIQLT